MSREIVGHRCGACGTTVYPVIFELTGLRMHVERSNRGNISIVPELPGLKGASLSHVRRDDGGAFKEHRHDSFSAASFERKRRTA